MIFLTKLLSANLLIASLSLFFSGMLWAQKSQTAEGTARGNAIRVPDNRAIQRQAPLQPKVDVSKPKPATAANDDNSGVAVIKTIRIEGNTVIARNVLLDELGPYQNKKFNFLQLNELAKKIENLYRSRGYLLAQAYLPKQVLKEGILLIRVIEGYCEGVKVVNKSLVSTDRIEKTFAQGVCSSQGSVKASSDPISLANLERASLLVSNLLVSELPGLGESPIRSTLSEGKSVGGTVLTTEVNRVDRLQGFMSIDNFGSKATGANVLSLGADINSPLGQGDRLSLRANTSGSGLTAYSTDYNYPLGYNGWRIGVNSAQIKYLLAEFGDSKGTSNSSDLYVSYPVIRRVLTNFDIRAAYGAAASEDILASGAKQSKSVNTLTLTGSGSTTSSSSARTGYGLSLMAGNTDSDDLSDPNSTKGAFTKLNYNVNHSRNLVGNVQSYINLRGQKALKNLDSRQKFTLGGSSAVRAFNGEGSVDNGNIVNVELRYRSFFGDSYQALFSVFYDYGAGQFLATPNATSGVNETTLSGTGFGVVLSKGGRYSLSIYNAQQQDGKSETNTDATGYTWAQLVVLF